MICSKCGKENYDQSRFCMFCGSPIQVNDSKPNLVGQDLSDYLKSVAEPRTTISTATDQSDYPPNLSNNIANDPVSFIPIPIESQEVDDRAVAAVQTITSEQNLDEIEVSVCPRCYSNNSNSAVFCGICGSPLRNASRANPMAKEIFCPRCGVTNQTSSKFCKNCGANLSSIDKYAYPYDVATLTNTRTQSLWLGIASIGSLLAFFCFFLPFIVINIANPVAWLIGGPDNITFTMSANQLLTNSAPTVKGLGGLGEMSANLYDELDIGQLMYEGMDERTRTTLMFGRFLTGLLLLSSITAMIFTFAAYKSNKNNTGKAMMVFGICALLLVILTGSVGGTSFKTNNSDLDILLNSAIQMSNGFGFWGMLMGFASFSIGGYLRK